MCEFCGLWTWIGYFFTTQLNLPIQLCICFILHPFYWRKSTNLSYGFNRETATPDKVKEAHRRVMVANHPDAGGSHYLASKINEAKDMMLGKGKSGGSAF